MNEENSRAAQFKPIGAVKPCKSNARSPSCPTRAETGPTALQHLRLTAGQVPTVTAVSTGTGAATGCGAVYARWSSIGRERSERPKRIVY